MAVKVSGREEVIVKVSGSKGVGPITVKYWFRVTRGI